MLRFDRGSRPATTWLPLLLCAACSNTRPGPMTRETARRIHEIAHLRELDPGLIEAGRRVLSGFPERLEGEGFRPGERLLYGVESFDGDEVEQSLLLLEAVALDQDPAAEPIEVELDMTVRRHEQEERVRRLVASPRARLCARLLDPGGEILAEDTSDVARLLHEAGWFAWARLHDGRSLWRLPEGMLVSPRTVPPVELRDRDWGRAATWTLLQHLLANEAMQEMLGRLSVAPGLGELGDFLGGTIDLYLGLEHPRIVDQPVPELPAGTKAFECGLSMYRGGRQLLVVNVVVVPAVGPMTLSGGIVTMTGYRGGDPERRFVMRLIAVQG